MEKIQDSQYGNDASSYASRNHESSAVTMPPKNMTIPVKSRGLSPSVRRWLAGGIALALVLGGYWYFSRSADDAGAARGGNAAPVRVGKVVRRDMPVVEHSLGTVVANTTVQVTAR